LAAAFASANISSNITLPSYRPLPLPTQSTVAAKDAGHPVNEVSTPRLAQAASASSVNSSYGRSTSASPRKSPSKGNLSATSQRKLQTANAGPDVWTRLYQQETQARSKVRQLRDREIL